MPKRLRKNCKNSLTEPQAHVDSRDTSMSIICQRQFPLLRPHSSHVSGCVGTAGDIAVSKIQHISLHRVKRWMVTQHFVQLVIKWESYRALACCHQNNHNVLYWWHIFLSHPCWGCISMYTTEDMWSNVSKNKNGLNDQITMRLGGCLHFSTVHLWSNHPRCILKPSVRHPSDL